jgi:hypothetical protein
MAEGTRVPQLLETVASMKQPTTRAAMKRVSTNPI